MASQFPSIREGYSSTIHEVQCSRGWGRSPAHQPLYNRVEQILYGYPIRMQRKMSDAGGAQSRAETDEK